MISPHQTATAASRKSTLQKLDSIGLQLTGKEEQGSNNLAEERDRASEPAKDGRVMTSFFGPPENDGYVVASSAASGESGIDDSWLAMLTQRVNHPLASSQLPPLPAVAGYEADVDDEEDRMRYGCRCQSLLPRLSSDEDDLSSAPSSPTSSSQQHPSVPSQKRKRHQQHESCGPYWAAPAKALKKMKRRKELQQHRSLAMATTARGPGNERNKPDQPIPFPSASESQRLSRPLGSTAATALSHYHPEIDIGRTSVLSHEAYRKKIATAAEENRQQYPHSRLPDTTTTTVTASRAPGLPTASASSDEYKRLMLNAFLQSKAMYCSSNNNNGGGDRTKTANNHHATAFISSDNGVLAPKDREFGEAGAAAAAPPVTSSETATKATANSESASCDGSASRLRPVALPEQLLPPSFPVLRGSMLLRDSLDLSTNPRIVFEALPPHRVVHSNAAYARLFAEENELVQRRRETAATMTTLTPVISNPKGQPQKNLEEAIRSSVGFCLCGDRDGLESSTESRDREDATVTDNNRIVVLYGVRPAPRSPVTHYLVEVSAPAEVPSSTLSLSSAKTPSKAGNPRPIGGKNKEASMTSSSSWVVVG